MKRHIYFCPEINSPRWQLHDKLNFGLQTALLTWSRTSSDVDSGPPPDVAGLLTQAMVRIHRVTFLVDDERVPFNMAAAGSSSVQPMHSCGVFAALAARWHGEPTRWNWLSTCDANVAGTLFDQARFDWTLQTQMVLLSSADAPVPTLDRELTQALWRGGSPQARLDLEHLGVQLLLRPGVDGSVVGVVSLQADVLPAWLVDLGAQCRARGWALQTRLESDLLGAPA